MSTFGKTILSTITIMAFSAAAFAHPHESDADKKDKAQKTEKSWPNFGDSDDSVDIEAFTEKLEKRFTNHASKLEKAIEKAEKRAEKRTENRAEKGLELRFDNKTNADDIRAAGEALEDLMADSDMISGLTDMLAGLVEDIEVEEAGDMTVLRFDGQKLGHIKVDRDRSDKMQIGGLGKILSIERDTYTKNGKTKTRIVIEMDGGEGLDIEMPETKRTP